MVDYGGSEPYYYYKNKKIPLTYLTPVTSVTSKVDWTVGKYSQQHEQQKKEEAKKRQLADDKKWLQKLREELE